MSARPPGAALFCLAGLLFGVSACMPPGQPEGAASAVASEHADDPCRAQREAVLGQATPLESGKAVTDAGDGATPDRLGSAFASLRDCRFAAADEIHQQMLKRAVSSDFAVAKLGAEKRWFEEEMAATRRASRGGGAPPAAPATPSPTKSANTSFVALARVNVRPGPDLAMAPITMLRKGEHVTGAAVAAAGGWRAVTLADGRSGFVAAKFLAPAPADAAAGSAPGPEIGPASGPSTDLSATLDAAALRAAGAFAITPPS